MHMENERNKAAVYLMGKKTGILERTAEGFRFTYNREYLSSENPEPVSLTLPLTEKTYENETLFPFFLGLIPEGWLLEITSRILKIDPDNTFQLLVETCRDCIGAVTVAPLEQGDDA